MSLAPRPSAGGCGHTFAVTGSSRLASSCVITVASVGRPQPSRSSRPRRWACPRPSYYPSHRMQLTKAAGKPATSWCVTYECAQDTERPRPEQQMYHGQRRAKTPFCVTRLFCPQQDNSTERKRKRKRKRLTSVSRRIFLLPSPPKVI